MRLWLETPDWYVMKLIRLIVGITSLICLTSAIVSAQQPAPARPATASTTSAPAALTGGVAIVDTEVFGNPKTGILRLIRAVEGVNREFLPQRDELQKLRTQYEQIVKEIDATKTVADQRTLATKADQAESLKKQIERKSQDASDAYSKRLRDASEPVWRDINNALEAYARQRGASVVFDVSKLAAAMLVVNNAVDITKGFVADYNQRNPVAVAPAPARPAATSPARP